MTTKWTGGRGRDVARLPARKLTFGLMLLMVAGCAECAPETVGTGVARLTIRNTGAIVTAINADTTCGFGSEAVLTNPTIEGSVGSTGSITWTVNECALDFGAGTEISSSCTGTKTVAKGKVTVSATRTISGVLTGNPENPVVPAGPDAVTIHLQKATFDNFAVEVSNSQNVLTMIDGSISAKVQPRLAVSASSGACGISTPHVTFSEVTYGPSNVHVKTPDNDFEVDVATSALKAQNGSNGVETNTIAGTITVFEESVTVPEEGDNGGLDPEFDLAKFEEGYACTPDLAQPVSYVCGDLTPRLADGAARLTVKTFGTIVSLIDANDACGFSAGSVLAAATPEGTVGGAGKLSFAVENCVVELPADTELSADCTGAKTLGGGKVTVSGTKVLSGIFTGNPEQPIVPQSDSPAAFDLTVSFENFKVSSSADANALLVKNGTLSGKLTPRTALAADSGACAISSPIARFEGLTWKDANVAVTSSSGTFDLQIGTSDISATNGAWEKTNDLAGTITVQGDAITVPTDKLGLNPTYDQEAFDNSWQCAPGLVTPVSHQCGFEAPLGQGAARLTARTLGMLAKLIDADTTCGFKTPEAVYSVDHKGTLGKDDGAATFTLSGPCTFNFPVEIEIGEDCSGVKTIVKGIAVISGTKTVRGFNTGNVPAQPVVPTTRDAVEFDLQVTFTDFTVKSSNSTSYLTAKSGTLSGKVAPRLALDSTTGVCSIATPVTTFSELTWKDAELTLVSDGNVFDLTVNDSNLEAVNGTKDENNSNKLTGTITVNGTQLPVPLPGTPAVLDPEFSQEAFDASYACTENMVIPPNDEACSFRQVLGTNAARLLVKNIATVTMAVDKNNQCGFSAAPSGFTGDPGDMGSLTWTANACPMQLPPDHLLSTNCVGTATHAGGKVTTTGTKEVVGLRGVDPALIPITPNAATIHLSDLEFEGFTLYDLALGETTPVTRSTIDGRFSTSIYPIAGESTVGDDVYIIPTPVGRLASLQTPAGESATITIVSNGSRFDLELSDVNLDAFSGSYASESNYIEGSLVVDGIPVTIGTGTPLDPAFDQAAFDKSYECTPDLKAPVPAN